MRGTPGGLLVRVGREGVSGRLKTEPDSAIHLLLVQVTLRQRYEMVEGEEERISCVWRLHPVVETQKGASYYLVWKQVNGHVGGLLCCDYNEVGFDLSPLSTRNIYVLCSMCLLLW
jgi:hypothetical protein